MDMIVYVIVRVHLSVSSQLRACFIYMYTAIFPYIGILAAFMK